MTKQRTTKAPGFLSRTTQALGRLLAGMVTLPERPQTRSDREYPIFPPF